MDPTVAPRRYTAEDLLAMGEEGRFFELDEGELIEMTPPGFHHGEVEGEAAYLLRHFLKAHPLGRLVVGDTGFKLAPDRVRAPDISFISRERLATTPAPAEGYYPGAPDLAIEIRSPGDSVGEILTKIGQLFQAGTRLVWVIDPRRKNVTVYRANGDVLILGEQDTLSGEDLLPGFSCRVAELFPQAD